MHYVMNSGSDGYMKKKNSKAETNWSEYMQAFLDYLRRPKTIFDIKDRFKAAVLLVCIIIVLQKVVQMLAD